MEVMRRRQLNKAKRSSLAEAMTEKKPVRFFSRKNRVTPT